MAFMNFFLVAFLQAKCNINHQGGARKAKCTPLYVAAQNGHLEVVASLLQAGCEKDLPQKDGATALFIAASEGHVAVVNVRAAVSCMLVRPPPGSHLMLVRPPPGSHLAVTVWHHVCILSMPNLFHPPMVMKMTRAPQSHCIVLFGACAGMVWQALVTERCKLDLKKDKGWTALHIACYNDHAQIALSLLRAGANVNTQTDMGCSPLFVAAMAGNESVIHALCDEEGGAIKDIDLNLAKEGGVTPLMIASKKGHLHIVKALLKQKGEKGVNANLTMKGGSNAVHIAADNKNTEVLDALIAAGASAIGKTFQTRKIK